VESRPRAVIGRAHGRQHGHISGKRRSKALQQAAAKALGSPEPVDDNEIDAVGNGLVDHDGSIRKATLIEATTLRAPATVFPDVVSGVGAKIDDMNRAGASTLCACRYLQ
jgi:hypothetical protein